MTFRNRFRRPDTVLVTCVRNRTHVTKLAADRRKVRLWIWFRVGLYVSDYTAIDDPDIANAGCDDDRSAACALRGHSLCLPHLGLSRNRHNASTQRRWRPTP